MSTKPGQSTSVNATGTSPTPSAAPAFGCTASPRGGGSRGSADTHSADASLPRHAAAPAANPHRALVGAGSAATNDAGTPPGRLAAQQTSHTLRRGGAAWRRLRTPPRVRPNLTRITLMQVAVRVCRGSARRSPRRTYSALSAVPRIQNSCMGRVCIDFDAVRSLGIDPIVVGSPVLPARTAVVLEVLEVGPRAVR